jgi:hypothetical protein
MHKQSAAFSEVQLQKVRVNFVVHLNEDRKLYSVELERGANLRQAIINLPLNLKLKEGSIGGWVEEIEGFGEMDRSGRQTGYGWQFYIEKEGAAGLPYVVTDEPFFPGIDNFKVNNNITMVWKYENYHQDIDATWLNKTKTKEGEFHLFTGDKTIDEDGVVVFPAFAENPACGGTPWLSSASVSDPTRFMFRENSVCADIPSSYVYGTKENAEQGVEKECCSKYAYGQDPIDKSTPDRSMEGLLERRALGSFMSRQAGVALPVAANKMISNGEAFRLRPFTVRMLQFIERTVGRMRTVLENIARRCIQLVTNLDAFVKKIVGLRNKIVRSAVILKKRWQSFAQQTVTIVRKWVSKCINSTTATNDQLKRAAKLPFALAPMVQGMASSLGFKRKDAQNSSIGRGDGCFSDTGHALFSIRAGKVELWLKLAVLAAILLI